jgi:hypothetical protein
MEQVLTCLNKECANYLMPFVPSKERKPIPCPGCEEPLTKMTRKKHNQLLPKLEVVEPEPTPDPFEGLDDGDTVTVGDLRKILGI